MILINIEGVAYLKIFSIKIIKIENTIFNFNINLNKKLFCFN